MRIPSFGKLVFQNCLSPETANALQDRLFAEDPFLTFYMDAKATLAPRADGTEGYAFSWPAVFLTGPEADAFWRQYDIALPPRNGVDEARRLSLYERMRGVMAQDMPAWRDALLAFVRNRGVDFPE